MSNKKTKLLPSSSAAVHWPLQLIRRISLLVSCHWDSQRENFQHDAADARSRTVDEDPPGADRLSAWSPRDERGGAFSFSERPRRELADRYGSGGGTFVRDGGPRLLHVICQAAAGRQCHIPRSHQGSGARQRAR